MLRLFCLFNSITSGPLYFFIVMFHFIVFLVSIYYSFCVCFISYIFVCYSFHYKYFCNYLQKKKNPIPGTRALRISSHLSIACSQALLRLAFFHRLPHLWLSTVLLNVHHFISLRFSLFALHFTFTSLLSQSPRHASGHIDIVTSLTSHFASGHVITHTHTLSLSLSLTHTHFPFGLRFIAVSPLGFTSHTSASHYMPCFAFSPFRKPLTIKAEASLTRLSDQATHKTPSTL